MRLTIELTEDQLDALADAVAERLKVRPREPAALVDAQTVADALKVTRETVYDNAARLGGRRIGDGTRPRWRFDLADALAAWEPTRATPRRRSQNGRRELLPVHGDDQ